MAIENYKLVGVIGGMGPLATVNFLNKVISLTPAKEDQDYIPMIIYINPQIPDRTRAILKKGKSPLKGLLSSARLLEESGAEFIIIPCVTAHFWIEKLRQRINIPIVSIIDVVLKKINVECPKVKRFGIMGTDGVIGAKLFNKSFNALGLEVIVPDRRVQKNCVMKGIYSIKKGNDPKKVKKLFLYAGHHLRKKGARAIILACTEIPLAITQNDIGLPLIDVNEELARETIKIALS